MGRPASCGGPLVVEAPRQLFSSGAVGAHPTLEYQNKIKGDKTYVEAPWLWRLLGNCPACPLLNPALLRKMKRSTSTAIKAILTIHSVVMEALSSIFYITKALSIYYFYFLLILWTGGGGGYETIYKPMST